MKGGWWIDKAGEDLKFSDAQIEWGEYDEIPDRKLKENVVKARQAVVVSKSLLVSIAATLNAIKLTLYVIAATLLAWLIYEIAK